MRRRCDGRVPAKATVPGAAAQANSSTSWTKVVVSVNTYLQKPLGVCGLSQRYCVGEAIK